MGAKKKLSKKDKARKLLEQGVRLTVVSAFMHGCGTELRKIISELKREGLMIKDRTLVSQEDPDVRFKEYWIGEELKLFSEV